MSGKSGRRRRHDDDHEEEHGPDERWLVTYADMVTLLMVLFIIMFAMSTVDERKYHDLKVGLADGFGRSESILNGSDPMKDDRGPGSPGQAEYDMLLDDLPQESQQVVAEKLAEADELRNAERRAEAAAEVDRLARIGTQAQEALRKAGLRGDARISVDDRGLVISLVSRHVVFAADVAELTPRGERVVDTLAPVLAAVHEDIEIDGHTNQVPVQPKYFPTDWELSAARAVHVLRRLQEVNGLPAARLQATGYGHTEPLIDPDRAGSQQINKRVDLVVLSDAPDDTRALLTELWQERYQDRGGTGGTDPAPADTPADAPADTPADADAGTHALSRPPLTPKQEDTP